MSIATASGLLSLLIAAPLNDIFTSHPILLLFRSNETGGNSGRDAPTDQVLTFLLLAGDKQPHKKAEALSVKKTQPASLFIRLFVTLHCIQEIY